QRAVERDQRKEPFQIGMDVRRVGELFEALENRCFIAAAVFLIGAPGVEDAEVLDTAVTSAGTQIEAIDDQRHAVLRELKARHIQTAALGDFEAEEFVGGKLGKFIRFPELDDVGCAPITLREACLLAMRAEGLFVPEQDLGLHSADAGKRGETLDEVAKEIAVAPVGENLID